MRPLSTLATLTLVLSACVIVSSENSTSTVKGDDEVLPHYAVLDAAGRVHLHWRPTQDGVLFRLVVATQGYVALGVSPGGGMRGADIAALAVDADGTPRLEDMHAVGESRPVRDQQQDVVLRHSRRNGTHTEVLFERRDSCDADDIPLAADTAVTLIWAYGEGTSPSGEWLTYHGTRRGQKLVNLHRPGGVQFAADAPYLDITAPSVSLPDGVRTFYFCRITKLPPFPRKVHFIGFQGLIQPGSEPFVHHVIVYECTVPEWRREAFEAYVSGGRGARCYSPNMPVDWGRCGHILAVWAVGGSGERLPAEVGIPLREEYGGATYLMAEIHYDNPAMQPGVVDSSGVRLYYTDDLRPSEAGLLNVGHDIAVTQMVPPRQAEYVVNGLCHSSCTQQWLPEQGVRVYSVLLHAHLAGTRMRLRHIGADGVELPHIAEDRSYAFNYQQTRALSEPVLVKPGDQLLVECVYDTLERSNITFGGLSAENEMCLAFVSYFPRVPLTLCWSSPDMGHTMERLGVESANAYGMELPVRRAGDMIQQVINNLESFARAQWDLDNPPEAPGGGSEEEVDETQRHLYQVALQDQRIMRELQADNISALEALGMEDLPEQLQDPFLILKDILVIEPSVGRMSTLFEFLLQYEWGGDGASRLQTAITDYYRPKCVSRDGRIRTGGRHQLPGVARRSPPPPSRCASAAGAHTDAEATDPGPATDTVPDAEVAKQPAQDALTSGAGTTNDDTGAAADPAAAADDVVPGDSGEDLEMSSVGRGEPSASGSVSPEFTAGAAGVRMSACLTLALTLVVCGRTLL